jgi:hypothetical protein
VDDVDVVLHNKKNGPHLRESLLRTGRDSNPSLLCRDRDRAVTQICGLCFYQNQSAVDNTWHCLF